MGKTHRIYSEINLENYASFIYRLYIFNIDKMQSKIKLLCKKLEFFFAVS